MGAKTDRGKNTRLEDEREIEREAAKEGKERKWICRRDRQEDERLRNRRKV